MRIRNGFVSNSSSSSFVVAFSRQPESSDEVFEMMFSSEDFTITAHNDIGISSRDAALRVWQDIQQRLHKLPLSRIQFAAMMWGAANLILYDKMQHMQRTGELPSPWEHGIDQEEQERRQAAEDAFISERADQMAEQFTQANPDSFICVFTYSDNGDGPFDATMEHGNVFRNLPCCYISEH